MSENCQFANDGSTGTPRWVPLAILALAAVSVLSLGIAWSATTHARSTEQGLQAQSGQSKTIQQGIGAINQRLAHAEDINAQLQAELKLVTDRLKMTQGELANARQQARQIRTEYSSKFDSVQSEMAAGQLVEVPVRELQVARKIHLVHPARRHLSHAARAFLELVKTASQ